MTKRGKNQGPPRSRSRTITPDEERLWRAMTERWQPLKRGKSTRNRAAKLHSPGLDDGQAAPDALSPPGITRDKFEPDRGRQTPDAKARTARVSPARPAKAPPQATGRATDTAQPPANDFDRRKARKLAAGHLDIEAVLDLHGLRQAEAHRALRSFLYGAHARGQRYVKVITGKGARTASDHQAGSSMTAPDDFELYSSRERGVLRRQVPQWLIEPELASIVVGFTAAGRAHGGEGALYIQIRKISKVRRN